MQAPSNSRARPRARRTSGIVLFTLLVLSVAGYYAVSRTGLLARLRARMVPPSSVALTAGDFPAGVAAPVGELASIPLRPTFIGFTPRGSAAALLLATGGVEKAGPGSIFRSAYALDARAVPFAAELELRNALIAGADGGGVDMAALPVDRFASWSLALRDAAPRAILLLGRSRGQEALATAAPVKLSELRGKRIAVYPHGSAYFFALWLLSREGMSLGDVRWVELDSPLEAGAALREGRADAAVGLRYDVSAAAKERGGGVLASSADAPHLIATVLVVRGEFAARYPDAVRRVLRGLLDAATAVDRDAFPAARILGDVAPYLGDPRDAIAQAPPASLGDNLSFFGLSGEAPVTYDELYRSAAALAVKTGRLRLLPRVEDSRDLGALQYVASTRTQ